MGYKGIVVFASTDSIEKMAEVTSNLIKVFFEQCNNTLVMHMALINRLVSGIESVNAQHCPLQNEISTLYNSIYSLRTSLEKSSSSLEDKLNSSANGIKSTIRIIGKEINQSIISLPEAIVFAEKSKTPSIEVLFNPDTELTLDEFGDTFIELGKSLGGVFQLGFALFGLFFKALGYYFPDVKVDGRPLKEKYGGNYDPTNPGFGPPTVIPNTLDMKLFDSESIDITSAALRNYNENLGISNDLLSGFYEASIRGSISQEELQKSIRPDEFLEKNRELTEGYGAQMLEQFGLLHTLFQEKGFEIGGDMEGMSTKILETLGILPKEASAIADNMMQGIWNGINSKEDSILTKVENLASSVIRKFQSIFQIFSPSRATRRIFQYVMEGAELGLEDEEGVLYSQTEGIAKGVLQRFAGAGHAALNTAALNLQAAVAQNQLRLAPAGVAAGGFGAAGAYVDNRTFLEQTIHSGTPLQPSQMTREAEDLMRRAKWQIK